jgi:methyl-accepting chemotaxis protein
VEATRVRRVLAPGAAAIAAGLAAGTGFPSVGLAIAVGVLGALSVDGWYLSSRRAVSGNDRNAGNDPQPAHSTRIDATAGGTPNPAARLPQVISPRRSTEGLQNSVQAAGQAIEQVSAAVQDGSGALVNLSSHLAELETNVRAATTEISASRGMTFQILGQVEVLGESSDQISAMVGSIRTIANQTNLLALNATIEAARAGEFGRGFAVVAAEVRSLAQNARSVTESIDAIVTEIKDMTAATIEIAEAASNQVEATATSMETTSENFGELRAIEASAEQALRNAGVHLEPVTETLSRLATDLTLLESTS